MTGTDPFAGTFGTRRGAPAGVAPHRRAAVSPPHTQRLQRLLALARANVSAPRLVSYVSAVERPFITALRELYTDHLEGRHADLRAAERELAHLASGWDDRPV